MELLDRCKWNVLEVNEVFAFDDGDGDYSICFKKDDSTYILLADNYSDYPFVRPNDVIGDMCMLEGCFKLSEATQKLWRCD